MAAAATTYCTYRIPRSEGRTTGGKGLRWNLEPRINLLSKRPLPRFVGYIQALAMGRTVADMSSPLTEISLAIQEPPQDDDAQAGDAVESAACLRGRVRSKRYCTYRYAHLGPFFRTYWYIGWNSQVPPTILLTRALGSGLLYGDPSRLTLVSPGPPE